MRTFIFLASLLFVFNAQADEIGTYYAKGLQSYRDTDGYLRLEKDVSRLKQHFNQNLLKEASSNDSKTAEENVLRACYKKLDQMTAGDLVFEDYRLIDAKRSGTRIGGCRKPFPTYQATVQLYQIQVTGCAARCTVLTLGNGSTKSTCRSEVTITETAQGAPFSTHAETYAGCPLSYDR